MVSASNRLNPLSLLEAPALGEGDINALPRGAGAVAVVALLRSRFGMDATTDEGIVQGQVENSSGWPGEAQGLCRPRTRVELAAALRACRRAALPCTVTAGRSSLTGSATPEGGLVIATDRLLDPQVDVDGLGRRARAPVGLVLERFREQVLERSAGRLHYPVDPTSRNDCLLGGTVACNASGFLPGPAGATRPWVQALEVVLPDGRLLAARRGQYRSEEGVFRIVSADGTGDLVLPVPRYPRPRIKNAGGPWSAPDGRMDFVDLIVGSEGLFGVVVACELALAEAPRGRLDFFCSLPDEPAALALQAGLRQLLEQEGQTLGDQLSALEYFGPGAREYMDHQARFFRSADRVAVYLEVPLYNQNPEALAGLWCERLLRAGPGLDEEAVQLLDAVGRRAFLEARHAVPARTLEVVRRRDTYTVMTDTAVPPEAFADYLEEVHALIGAAGIEYLSFGHLADCHLHFMMLPARDQLERAQGIYDAIVAGAAARGGVYSGEHGTGKRKRRDFERCYGAAGITAVQRAKAALDPDFLLNRGNVVRPPR